MPISQQGSAHCWYLHSVILGRPRTRHVWHRGRHDGAAHRRGRNGNRRGPSLCV